MPTSGQYLHFLNSWSVVYLGKSWRCFKVNYHRRVQYPCAGEWKKFCKKKKIRIVKMQSYNPLNSLEKGKDKKIYLFLSLICPFILSCLLRKSMIECRSWKGKKPQIGTNLLSCISDYFRWSFKQTLYGLEHWLDNGTIQLVRYPWHSGRPLVP